MTPAILFNCCPKNAEPVWSRFRSLSISGVRDLRSQTGGDETECVACPDDEAQFWTVYGRTKDGDSEALTDLPTKPAALIVAGFHMSRARCAGVPLDLEEWTNLSLADATLACSSAAAMVWQPIETAPTSEEEPFLVLLPKNGVAPFVVLQVSRFEGRLYPDARDACIDWENGITTATHWMPTPKPGAST